MDLMDYRRKIIANSPHLKSASGAVATFSDGADLPLKSLNVDIEPVQDLHGYENPWPAGGGVNKIDYLSCIGIGRRDGTDSIFGNNTSISGKQLTINRSYAQGGGLLKGVGVFPMSTGDKVTISGSVTLTNTNRMYVGVGNYDGGGTNGILVVTPSSGKFVVTVTAGSDYAKTGIFLQPESVNSSMVVSNVMVALGETEKTYEPYENICPIRGWNGVNVTRSGKSALKPSTAFTETKNGLTFTSDGNGTYSVKGTNTATATVRSAILPVSSFTIPPSTTHTLYINNNAINSDVLLNFMIGSTAIDSWAFNALNREVPTYGAMGNKLCDGLQIVVRAGQTVDITFSPMLLPKENADVYNISLSSAGTVYGGTLNPLTGVLTVDRYWWELSTVASQWNKSSTYSGGFYTGGANYVWNWQQVKPNTPFLCSHAKTATTLSEYGANRNVCYMDNSINIRIMSDTATKQDWIDYLTAQKSAGTPVQICCYLRNPVIIQLTPHQIRSLYGNNTIFADTGNVALEYWARP